MMSFVLGGQVFSSAGMTVSANILCMPPVCQDTEGALRMLSNASTVQPLPSWAQAGPGPPSPGGELS